MSAINKKVKVSLPKVQVSKTHRHYSVVQLVFFIAVFALIGGYIIFRSFAATPVVATIQAESMSQPAGSSIVSDSNAVGAQALKLTQNGATTATLSLPSQATSVTIRARGSQCSGSPTMSMNVDGGTVLASATVGSSSYADYIATHTIGAGSHTISISGNNLGSARLKHKTCYRTLYIDVTTFYGPAPVATPAPTVTFSSSPTSITAGASSTLAWSSTNASSCTAGGSWSGTKTTSGSETVTPTASTQYSLTCTGTGGSGVANTSVSVSAATTITASSSIYWGAWIDGDVYAAGSADAPWSATTAGGSWDLFEQHAGKKVSIIHYGQPPMWTSPFSAGNINLITSRGAIPFMDMTSQSVPLTDITSGKYDSSIAAWGQAAKASGKPFFYRWNWEMNGTWFDYGAQAKQNPANYVAAWRHMHDVIAAQGASNVTWVWCPNTEFTGSTPLSQLYPGDSYVDWTCVDGYNWGTSPYKADSWKTFNQVFQQTYNSLLSLAPSKPIIIGETSSSEYGGSKAGWITDAYSTQLPNNYPHVKGIVAFNWNIFEGGGNLDWPIESSSTAQAAFAKSIASPYYSSNTYGSLPALTKVQPLK